jgi:hypothetical protein
MTGRLETPPSEGRALRSERPRGSFTTASARTTPIEYTRAERFWFRLESPPRLQRFLRPPLRRILASIRRLIPERVTSSRVGRLVGGHPAFTSWAAMFAAAVLVIVSQQFGEPHFRWDPVRYEKWLLRQGTRAVKTSLAEIGPAVTIPAVHAKPTNEFIAGYYTPASGEITFNSSVQHIPCFLLETAAHECVHGIFVQNDLTPADTMNDDFLILVNEVAANVLAAHIVGNVMSRDGHDGSIVTEVLFQGYRRECDPAELGSLYQLYLTADHVSPGRFDRWEWHQVLTHFGAPLELVDEVHEICYLNTDPVEAARKISRRFMTRDLAPKDRPILEEFERTRARWNQVR